MTGSGSRSQVRPLESFKHSRFELLAIASFIIHYLGGQARNMFWGHLSEMLLYRASEATTFVNTCRLLGTSGPIERTLLGLETRGICTRLQMLEDASVTPTYRITFQRDT
jgi:hypothetical protein